MAESRKPSDPPQNTRRTCERLLRQQHGGTVMSIKFASQSLVNFSFLPLFFENP
jgi:hypothetical protein